MGEGTFRKLWNLKHWPVENFLKCHLRMIKWCINCNILLDLSVRCDRKNSGVLCMTQNQLYWPRPLF